MKRDHLPTDGAKKRLKGINYAETFFDSILIIIGEFLLAWFNVPQYVSWLFLAFCVLAIIAAHIFWWRPRRELDG